MMHNTTDAKPQKKLLYEVSIIRPLVITLLVFLHSFTKIANGGGKTNDYQLVNVYQWVCWLISGFRIETIALVAGYVFSYQSHDLKRSYQFVPFVWKKFKRLIIPMLFFGCIYYFCFFFDKGSFSLLSFVKTLLSGCGHLWFLPMLFWCFIAIWIIDHYKLSSIALLVILAGVSLVPMPSLPFGFTRLPHFLFFVFAGYYLWTQRDRIFGKYLNTRTIVSMWVVYVLLVVIKHLFVPEMTSDMPILKKIILSGMQSTIGLVMSCSGILALYMTVCKVTTKENYRPKQWIVKASDDCYGVYVFHQFILVALYFYTPLVSKVNAYLVPWIGFAAAFSISLLLTKLFLKTKVGRFLIG